MYYVMVDGDVVYFLTENNNDIQLNGKQRINNVHDYSSTIM